MTFMRTGVPDEYAGAIKILKENHVIEESAQQHIPQLYRMLRKYGYTPKNSRVVIVDSCKGIFGLENTLKHIPIEDDDN